MNIPFESKEHQNFFYACLKNAKYPDEYHQALFYTMGISEVTRKTISQWFSFENDGIKPDCLDADWQTGSSRRLTRLAFNLWNGYSDDRTNPYDMFDCSYGKYMLEGIKLRYPEYCRLPEPHHSHARE